MCSHLSLPFQPSNIHQRRLNADQAERTDSDMDLSAPVFPLPNGSNVDAADSTTGDPGDLPSGNILNDSEYLQQGRALSHNNIESAQDQIFSKTDMSNITLDGENDLYWLYHTPGFSFTGVDHADWEALESQLTWS